MTRLNVLSGVFLLCLFSLTLSAQPTALPAPRVSPQALVSQTIGLTEITVNYSRPAVRDRQVWGALVPYGQVWRTGANENTTISFSHPVSIAGKTVPAGTYGLHSIPTEGDWTVVISNNPNLWGSFRYDQSEDLMRFTVKPQAHAFQEYLVIGFPEITDNSATLQVAWADLAFSFPISIDVHEAVVERYRQEIRGVHGFFAASLATAARYCATNNTHTEQGIAWIDQALGNQPTFANYSVKARLLENKGDAMAAQKLIDAHLGEATEAEVNAYGYQLLGQGKKGEAIAIFKRNVKNFPKSWNTYDSLGEALQASGDTKQAISNYRKALDMVADPTQKTRINQILDQLNKG
ncbi:MAG TPA: DUF2911 domain-containing protein [Calditrichia bacterium]|nr:DUF2911 domain-containing protein [Calditrichota bacterium]HQV33021.1 DUF2911 domain-containing protein [Calditrichia bacterium]